jgi:hypothetical protein
MVAICGDGLPRSRMIKNRPSLAAVAQRIDRLNPRVAPRREQAENNS